MMSNAIKRNLSKFKPISVKLEGGGKASAYRLIVKNKHPIKQSKQVIDLFKCPHCLRTVSIIHDLKWKPLGNLLLCPFEDCERNIFKFYSPIIKKPRKTRSDKKPDSHKRKKNRERQERFRKNQKEEKAKEERIRKQRDLMDDKNGGP